MEGIITFSKRKTGELGSMRKYFKSFRQRKSMHEGPCGVGNNIQGL